MSRVRTRPSNLRTQRRTVSAIGCCFVIAYFASLLISLAISGGIIAGLVAGVYYLCTGEFIFSS